MAGEGRLVNLAAAEGHPSAVMDMSFANQALAAEYMLKNGGELERDGLRRARWRSTTRSRASSCTAMGVEIDTLTAEQEHYLNEWTLGTGH